MSKNSPICGVGVKQSISGTTMTIKTKAVFYADAPADNYNMAVYIVENGIVHPQADATGEPADFVHNHVLRGAGNDKIYGELISSTAIRKGQKFENTFSLSLKPQIATNVPLNAANLHVIAVVYKMGKDKPVDALNVNGI